MAAGWEVAVGPGQARACDGQGVRSRKASGAAWRAADRHLRRGARRGCGDPRRRSVAAEGPLRNQGRGGGQFPSPAHCARWCGDLSLPVSVHVVPDHPALLAGLIERVDRVVWAGGPLMDLPKMLLGHLNVALMARRAGKPFIIEGVGIGPLRWSLSRWMARRIIELADEISVRSHGASASCGAGRSSGAGEGGSGVGLPGEACRRRSRVRTRRPRSNRPSGPAAGR